MLEERTKELNQLKCEMEDRICNASTSLERDLNEAKLKYKEVIEHLNKKWLLYGDCFGCKE